jgi:predicted nucleic acid-binding protein
MKIFLDANVLIAVLNEEYPAYTYCAWVVSLAGSGRFKVYTSPLCLAIAFYFAEKKNRRTARHRISVLASHLHICSMDADTVKHAIANKRVHDLEDGLQYYAALESGCKIIVTEDGDDFYFSELEVLTSRTFMEKYVFKRA